MKIKQIIKLCGWGLFLAISGISVFGNRFWYKAYINEKKLNEKNLCLKQLFIKWLDNKENGIKISDYLNEIHIRTIAIYGMGDAGCKLYDELKNSNITVKYAIDKRMIESDIDVVTLDDELQKVDMIIVTAICDFEEIFRELKKRTENRVISLEQIIYEAEGSFI